MRRKPASETRHAGRRSTLTGSDTHASRGIFISYRREDTSATAEHLYASLSQHFGADGVFRDVATIQPGQEFPVVIADAIRQATALIVLIGPHWLTARHRNGRPRLESPADLVRREIELAFTLKVPVIPVLVDGARMPTRTQLPPSIAPLAARHAYTLPWQEGIARLKRRIDDIDRERLAREAAARAERGRLDLAHGRRISATRGGSTKASKSYNVVTRAMEMSLAHQGRPVVLDPRDLAASLKRINPQDNTDQWFVPDDMVYAIDILGVKARGSKQRFVARSYPLKSLEEIPGQLQLGRPILTGLQVLDSWNREPALSTGVVDGENPGNHVINILGVIFGWEPLHHQARVLTGQAHWGDKGIAMLSQKAIAQSIDTTMLRSIEAVPMPEPPRSAER